MNLAEAAIRLGEALPWPDRLSTAVIDRLVRQTRRRLTRSEGHSGASFLRAAASLPIAINTAEANAQTLRDSCAVSSSLYLGRNGNIRAVSTTAPTILLPRKNMR